MRLSIARSNRVGISPAETVVEAADGGSTSQEIVIVAISFDDL